MNDREWILAQKDEQQAERNATVQLQHYEALGMGLAVFCVAMYTTLLEDKAKTFTKEQALGLVQAAVQGR